MSSLLYELVQFFYPSSCLHCTAKLKNPFNKLCDNCLSHIHLFEENPSVCFEKLSPACDLFQNYFLFQSKKVLKFFIEAIILKYFQNASGLVDRVSFYHPLDDKWFFNTQKPLEIIVKHVAKTLHVSYSKTIKQRLNKVLFDENGLRETLHKRPSKPVKRLLLISLHEVRQEKKEEINRLLSLEHIQAISLFE